MTEWLLDILEDLGETKNEDKKKILKLIMDENEYTGKQFRLKGEKFKFVNLLNLQM